MQTKILTTAIFLITNFTLSSAQITKKDVKRFNKSYKLYNKKKYEKALNLINPIVERNKDHAALWQYKIEYLYQDYKASSTTFGNIIVVGKDGKVDIPSSKQFESILYGLLNSSFKKNWVAGCA